MPANENLSPEERLLRVIQGSAAEETPPPAPAAPAEPQRSEPEGERVADDTPSIQSDVERDAAVVEEEIPAPVLSASAELLRDTPEMEEVEDVAPSETTVAQEKIISVEEPVKEESQEDEERPKLQLIRKEDPLLADDVEPLDVPVEIEPSIAASVKTAEGASEQAETVEEDQGELASVVPMPIMVAKKRKENNAGIRKMNRLLMVAAMLVLALIGFQIWASVRERPAPEPLPGDILLPDSVEVSELPPIEDIQNLFVEKPWFRDTTGDEDDDKEDKVPPDDKLDQIKLVGVSLITEGKWEAIIVDKKIGKMHFLQVGDRMVHGEGSKKELTLIRVTSDSATVSDGRKEYELKGK